MPLRHFSLKPQLAAIWALCTETDEHGADDDNDRADPEQSLFPGDTDWLRQNFLKATPHAASSEALCVRPRV
jgi:hypothetical protein